LSKSVDSPIRSLGAHRDCQHSWKPASVGPARGVQDGSVTVGGSDPSGIGPPIASEAAGSARQVISGRSDSAPEPLVGGSGGSPEVVAISSLGAGGRVGMWRGGSMLRFHIPLIEPGGRISRTRLSDKDSCGRSREAAPMTLKLDQAQLLEQEFLGKA
jgi:hypothetical protein